VAVLVLAACTACGTQPTRPAPTLRLDAAVREGFDRGRLVAADRRFAATPGLLSVIVARHGRIAFERYYHGGRRDARLNVFSVTKSVVSALVGIALRDAALRSVDQRIVEFFPGRGGSSVITLRHLLTMTAGYREGRIVASDDWVGTALNRPLEARPGASFSYDSPSAHLVAVVLTRATGEPLATYASRTLFEPLGIRPGGWATDGRGHQLGSSGLHVRARDLVAFGQLYLQNGRWHGRQVVPAAWVRASTSRHVAITRSLGYGYLWWITPDGFAAFGYAGQMLAVVPSRDIVVVMTGSEVFDRLAVLRTILAAASR
jgi:CubicO group peptidase (beta-lactamase class C family)